MTEKYIEGILNSDPASDIPLSLSNILRKKFLQSLERGISCWRKKFLQSLQTSNKWQSGKRNFCVRDVVLLCQNETGRNQWPMAKVTEVFKDSK